MVRQYDSSRRKKAAERTRRDILQAALKLHWEGITGFEALAREAGCSVATLRKHFPSKETLFGHCTRTFAETLTMPDLPALGAITEPAQRIEQGVSELCRMHEAMFGYAWLSAQQRKDSPTLDAVMNAYEGLADAIAGIITPAGSSKASLVRGLLDFLSYRALRLSGRLSPERTKEELIATLRQLILEGTHSPVPSPARRAPSHETQ
jgi:AcrR family transcriptional regulator